ncbi:hypothetical protein JTE90_016517 [Oedothorax gibbosus]|uniref:Uncharacterized protein n=1 Tax=Oedothorax gibbosus TaxID=931172 RepID=A0AAV6TD80_9ARAC|nr:hypothetical protein JTE90_016517 [Oedothorax gibbosus]
MRWIKREFPTVPIYYLANRSKGNGLGKISGGKKGPMLSLTLAEFVKRHESGSISGRCLPVSEIPLLHRFFTYSVKRKATLRITLLPQARCLLCRARSAP